MLSVCLAQVSILLARSDMEDRPCEVNVYLTKSWGECVEVEVHEYNI